MIRSYIKSTGSYFPQKVLTNDDLSRLMDTNNEWIFDRTGIRERRIASPDEYTSDLAVNATKSALNKIQMDMQDIDLILFSITFSEQSFPNTAARLQQKLGISNNCPCLDINAACTGWLYGLEVADMYIKSGKYQNILLVGGERPSSFLDWSDRNTAILFGDGCGVAIISRSNGNESFFVESIMECNSSYIDDLSLTNGGQISPFTKSDFEANSYPFKLYMNGKRIFKEAVNTMSSLSSRLILQNGMSMDDIDWIVPHQANLRIIEALSKKLGFSKEKIALNIENYGNTSSATIPGTLDKYTELNKIKRGDLLLLTSFGAGLTSGAALLHY